MSTRYRECYDATDEVVNDIIAIMDYFFNTHPDADDYFMLFFKIVIQRVMKHWKLRMRQRRPFDFNARLSECTDISLRQIERISLKD